MKKLLILLIINAIILVPSCIHQQTIYENQANLLKKFPTKAFVQIIQRVRLTNCNVPELCQPKTETSVGSGLSLGPHGDGTIILTAAHVCRTNVPEGIEYKSGLFIRNTGGISPAAIIHTTNLASDKSLDLCSLYVPNIKVEGVGLSLIPPKVGETVYALSAPVGVYHPPTVPILSGIYSGPIPDSNAVLTTIPAVGGSSGSSVLNGRMKIVGVIFASHVGFPHASIASNHKQTRNFINKTLKIFYRVFRKNPPMSSEDWSSSPSLE
jgi:S1-C subfamily serine protease